MATIRPFQAIRPDPAYADQTAALPYDVMNSDEAREMAHGNPYSFLHVDKAEIDLDPSVNLYDDAVYEKAGQNLRQMIADHVFIRDCKPYLYLYRLTMNGRAQTGLVVCTSIDEYLSGVIKKHELTREDKEQDRIRHVEACNANTGPIFLTCRAKESIILRTERWKNEHEPVYDFVTEDGIGHTVWVVDDPSVIAALMQEFQAVPCLYIADGHHRNASAVKVGVKRRESNPAHAKDAEFLYYLSVIFPDNELLIMDYNRLVKDLNGLTENEFLEKTKEKFHLEEKRNAAEAKPDRAHSFGMYLGGKWYRLAVHEEILRGCEDDPVRALDVSILQNELLEPLLNISDPRTDKRIDFAGGLRGLAELEKRVNAGEMAVAFAMYPTSMDELLRVADADQIMPPKSTWFEPKLRSGLFIHELGD